MRFTMYPDSGYNGAHAQSVCTRPFSPRWEGPGDEANCVATLKITKLCMHVHTVILKKLTNNYDIVQCHM